MGKPDLTVRLGGLKLKNPLIASSGTYGYGTEYGALAGIESFGAVVLKGITFAPREGNPPPRIFETSSGLLNSIGLENCGIKAFVEDKLPSLRGLETAVIANITGSESEVSEMLAMLEGAGIDACEINLSCPNLKGRLVSLSPELSGSFIRSVRGASSLPLIAKLSPAASDIAGVARACREAGADILSLINTFPAMAVDAEKMRPVLGNITGGLSGPAIKPIALKMVWDVCSSLDAPVIGMGGIMTASDAVEFILAGASAVSVGTGIFADPSAAADIVGGISDYISRKGFNSLSDIKGALDVS